MQIQLLIPSQNERILHVHVAKNETVSVFRKIVSNVVQIPANSFLLISLGKIMLDDCADKTPATLSTTYRVKHKTCIFVHCQKKSQTKSSQVEKAKNLSIIKIKKEVDDIIRDNRVVTIPFGNTFCQDCQNDQKKKRCQECGCRKCLLKTGDPLICDQCDGYWHIECAELATIPTDRYWYCPDCRNKDYDMIVGKGVAIKDPITSKRIITVRDVDCVIVPSYHVGKIPGIYSGQTWATRSLVQDWGIHRASKEYIAGSQNTGAVSLLLSALIKEDRDDGYEFIFSGIGGGIRNSRNNPSHRLIQSSQIMEKHNKALAVTCDAPFDEVNGAVANNWRRSLPVRVCRTSLMAKTHPRFAPKEGIRYDGTYKLVEYWPHREKLTGFIIWRYLFRRDDRDIAPWTIRGRQIVTRRGLRMIKSDEEDTEKLVKYNIPTRIQNLMKKDTLNKRLWKQICKMDFWSEYEFLHYVFDVAVICPSNVCSKPIKEPITTPCGHVCCMKCLIHSKANLCFTCRSPIPAESIKISHKLISVLSKINWAYDGVTGKRRIVSVSASDGSDLTVESVYEHGQKVELHPSIKREFTALTVADLEIANNKNSRLKKKRRNTQRVQVHIESFGNTL